MLQEHTQAEVYGERRAGDKRTHTYAHTHKSFICFLKREYSICRVFKFNFNFHVYKIPVHEDAVSETGPWRDWSRQAQWLPMCLLRFWCQRRPF